MQHLYMSLNSKYKNKKNIFSIKPMNKLLETAKIDFEHSKSISKQTHNANYSTNNTYENRYDSLYSTRQYRDKKTANIRGVQRIANRIHRPYRGNSIEK